VALKSEHTLHAEHMVTVFDTRTYLLKCECGENKAVVSINWGDGVLHITAIDDEYTVDIPRNGPVTRWKNQ